MLLPIRSTLSSNETSLSRTFELAHEIVVAVLIDAIQSQVGFEHTETLRNDGFRHRILRYIRTAIDAGIHGTEHRSH